MYRHLEALAFSKSWPGFLVLSLLFTASSKAAVTPHFLMPMSCAELMPDTGPFLGFFEAVGRGAVASDPVFSAQIFKVLSLRERLADATERVRDANPVDTIIRKTVCFYREQKEPLKPVAYDDTEFIKFLKGSLKELEDTVKKSVSQAEYEKQQRHAYERALQQNQALVSKVKKKAEADAQRLYDQLAKAARRKVDSE